MKQYIDGIYVKSHKLNQPNHRTYKQITQRNKRAQRDTRMLKVLSV